jgi:hypothetical protein
MMPKNELSKHYNPKVEWWFVGIYQAMVGKCKNRSVFQGFVGNTQVPQLIIRSKVPENEDGQYSYCVKDKTKICPVNVTDHFIVFWLYSIDLTTQLNPLIKFKCFLSKTAGVAPIISSLDR